jgi:xylan 1,4-beta-xylosidase
MRMVLTFYPEGHCNVKISHLKKNVWRYGTMLALSALSGGIGSMALAADLPEKQWSEFQSFTYEGTDKVLDKMTVSDKEYTNPIEPGYYPDPSICRVGKDFYLINSSFSYYPGVPISHSTDLVNWKQIGYVLNRPSQLNLDGLPVSSGIYAPAISYHDGTFYMITTNVGGIGNFYVTAKNPAGPWSDPIKLPKIDGIDPSFFFDDDGKVYIVHNGEPPERKALYNGHRAIWLWEVDLATGQVKDGGRVIVNGGVDITKNPSWIEGPHLFKTNGYYYLSCAEGGTSTKHSQVVFRTQSLSEPFVPYAKNPILTQRDLDKNRSNPIACTGHMDMVDAGNGEWWAVFLGVRPYEGDMYNIGRETFMLPVTWEDGWPAILKPGQEVPRVVKRPNLPAGAKAKVPTSGSFKWTDDFKGKELNLAWNFLRTPREQWWSLKSGSLLVRPRAVTLTSSGRNAGNPSFIARRQQHLDFSAETTLIVNSKTASSEAGLAALQNDANYFFLGVRVTDGRAKEVFLEQHTKRSPGVEVLATLPLADDAKSVELKMTGAGKDYAFFYRTKSKGEWTPVKEKADGTLLSTNAGGGFVGTMIGMYSRLPQATQAAAPVQPVGSQPR